METKNYKFSGKFDIAGDSSFTGIVYLNDEPFNDGHDGVVCGVPMEEIIDLSNFDRIDFVKDEASFIAAEAYWDSLN